MQIIWITGTDILMPCVPVREKTRVVVKRGMVSWRDEKSTMWVREDEYDSFRRSLERFVNAP